MDDDNNTCDSTVAGAQIALFAMYAIARWANISQENRPNFYLNCSYSTG